MEPTQPRPAVPPQGPFCQSCGMPMQKPEDFGLNADGTKTGEYCCFCFQDGSFIDPDATLEQMIEKAIEILTTQVQMPAGQAQAIANTFIPRLKRWQ